MYVFKTVKLETIIPFLNHVEMLHVILSQSRS